MSCSTPCRSTDSSSKNGELSELYVGVEGDRLCEVVGPPSTPAITARIGELAHGLPDGYRGEVNLGIDTWWAGLASETLDAGYVMTVDYGYDRAQLYKPARWPGTLRCYYRHTHVDEPLARVGQQDLTAHVDFTAVDEALGQLGFDIAGHTTQGEFLTRVGADGFVEALRIHGMSPFEQAANRAGILELLNPRGMGGFRVSIHARNAPFDRLIGLTEPDSQDIIPIVTAPDIKHARRSRVVVGQPIPGRGAHGGDHVGGNV